MAPAHVLKRIDGEINLGHLKYSKYASRLTFNKFKTDAALSYQYDGELKDHVFGIDLKGDIKAGYHLETTFTYNSEAFDSDSIEKYWESVFGLDYSFSGRWVVLGEYIYNGPGQASETELETSSFSLLDKFQYRHYLYSQVSYQHDIFILANAFVLWNIVDRSLVFSPGINYSLFQNTDLDLYGQIFLGDDGDEYGPERLGVNQIYYVKLTVKF
jgi:hypothetical protein